MNSSQAMSFSLQYKRTLMHELLVFTQTSHFYLPLHFKNNNHLMVLSYTTLVTNLRFSETATLTLFMTNTDVCFVWSLDEPVTSFVPCFFNVWTINTRFSTLFTLLVLNHSRLDSVTFNLSTRWPHCNKSLFTKPTHKFHAEFL